MYVLERVPFSDKNILANKYICYITLKLSRSSHSGLVVRFYYVVNGGIVVVYNSGWFFFPIVRVATQLTYNSHVERIRGKLLCFLHKIQFT